MKRVRLTKTIDRYPHFIAPAGATGTVRESSAELLRIHLDEHIPGAEDWDNEVCFYPEDGEEFTKPPIEPIG